MREFIKLYIRPNNSRIIIGLIIKSFATFTDLILPFFLAKIIDEAIPSKSMDMVYIYGAIMAAVALAGLVTNILANWFAASVTRTVSENLRYDLFTKTIYLTRSQADKFTNPSLISRLTTDTYNVVNTLNIVLRMGVRAPMLLVGGLIFSFSIDSELASVLLIVQPFVFGTVILLSKFGLPLYKELQERIDKAVLVIRENITGIRVIKAMLKTKHEKKRFADVNSEIVESELKIARLMSFNSPLITLFFNLGLALVVLFGAYHINEGKTQVGVIIALMSYFIMILNSMHAISRLFIYITKARASFSRISVILHEENTLLIESTPEIESDYHIEFNDVSFSYHKNAKNLTDISFKLKRGQSLGIIGPTGSGKTSIIRLLMRFYDVSTGEILIDGRNIKSIPFDELYPMFGIVFQDDVIFADTIAENIDFGRGISYENLERSIKTAQADEFVSSLDDQLCHLLAIKGANLSGGQKQRILISRALAASPEILVLDDSSSALDYKTDLNLRASIDSQLKGSTSIVVAQRISSIKDSDLIIVMEDGEIRASGTHEDLMEKSDDYKKICDIQLGA